MFCPQCQIDSLQPHQTNTGVELDYCNQCGSIWFDRGELFFFTSDVRGLNKALEQARQSGTVGGWRSPKNGQPMVDFQLPQGAAATLDSGTGGIWLSGPTAQQLTASGGLTVVWAGADAKKTLRFKVPNLLLRSIFTLGGLYALVTFILIVASLAGGVSPLFALVLSIGFGAFQFLIGPFIMDLFLRWAYSGHWVAIEQLPPHLQQFLTRVCGQHNMKLPRVAIIEDLSPNAFTYGHTPNNARLALTRGIFELLEPVEVEAVVGHELGHARNWDMALMTLAQMVPMILYYIYRVLIRVNSGRARAATATIAIGAFILYIISEYVVLWFSRTREYHADKFGAEAAGSPAALARALVKVAYGLAGRGQDAEQKGVRRASTIGAMGIFDASAAQSLTVVSGGETANAAHAQQAQHAQQGYPQPGQPGPQPQPAAAPPKYTIDSDNIKGAMKWDLWNPWASWFELNSTHPLVAKRLLHLSELSIQMGEQPLVLFDLPKPESYWDEFLVDVAVKLLPIITLIGALVSAGVAGEKALGPGVIAFGLAIMLKLLFRYPTHSFPEMSVATLLRQVKVSDIRPVPCRLEGTIRGRGVPGLIVSDDFVMQDDTGIIFIDHRQPLALWELIWGWLRGGKLIGGHVVVSGWYRRAPVPFVEINQFTVDGVKRRSWLRHFRWATAFLVVGGGIFITLVTMGIVPM